MYVPVGLFFVRINSPQFVFMFNNPSNISTACSILFLVKFGRPMYLLVSNNNFKTNLGKTTLPQKLTN